MYCACHFVRLYSSRKILSQQGIHLVGICGTLGFCDAGISTGGYGQKSDMRDGRCEYMAHGRGLTDSWDVDNPRRIIQVFAILVSASTHVSRDQYARYSSRHMYDQRLQQPSLLASSKTDIWADIRVHTSKSRDVPVTCCVPYGPPDISQRLHSSRQRPSPV